MIHTIERIRFTNRVLGALAAYRLEKRQVIQTLRSGSGSITQSILGGRVSVGDHLEIELSGILVGHAKLISMEAVDWEYLNIDDAWRGGFDTLADLEQALKRAGYRFKPLNNYQLFRIQFTWPGEAPTKTNIFRLAKQLLRTKPIGEMTGKELTAVKAALIPLNILPEFNDKTISQGLEELSRLFDEANKV